MSTLCMRLLLAALIVLSSVSTLAAVEVSDFLVNQEDFPGVFEQDQVSVAQAANGNYVVCWRDFRNGTSRGYYQLFTSDGQAIGANQLIDDRSIFDYGGPRVAMNASGQFIICYGSAASQVWARSFAADGTPLGDPFVAADDLGMWGGFKENNVALNDAGHAVLVVRGQLDDVSEYVLLGQLLDINSGRVGDMFQISEEFPPTWRRTLNVVLDEADRIFCVYTIDTDIYDKDVRLSRFTYADPGTISRTTVDTGYVVEGVGRADVAEAFLAYHPDGRIAVLWAVSYYEQIGTNSWASLADTTFVSVFDLQGAPIADHVRIQNDETFPGYDWCVDLAATATGFAVMLTGVSNPDFPVIELDLSGQIQYPITTFSTSDDSENLYGWQMFYPTADRVVFLWEGAPYTEPYHNVYQQGFALDGIEAFPMSRVHDDHGSWQSFPAIATDYAGNALVVWIDNRNSVFGDVYGQVLDPNGNPIGENFRISDDPLGEGFAKQVTVGSNGVDRAVVVWTGNGADHYAVRAQALDAPFFTPTGGNFIVHEPDFNMKDFWPDVGVRANSEMVFTWRDRLGSSDYVYNTYYQYYNANRTPFGGYLKVNDSDGAEVCWGCESLYFDFAPRIAMQPNGRFGIVWLEKYWLGGPFDVNCVVGQFYAGWGSPIGTNIIISDDASGVQMIDNAEIPPDICVNSLGEYGIAWTGGHNSAYYGAWARVFLETGYPLGDQVRYTDHHVISHGVTASIVAGPGDDFICSWYDVGDEDPDILAQKISATCQLKGAVMRIDNSAAGSEQSYPTAGSFEGTAMFVWQDFRSGSGNADIYSRYLNWADVGYSYGDIDLDGLVNITDVVFLIDYIFNSGQSPESASNADVNCDGLVNITDAVYLINYIFAGGPVPDCS